jgi:signal transduction histidine kinase/DNA-binding response OmpR family regulator
MSEINSGIAVNESYNGEDVIIHLIETARTLMGTDIDQSKEFLEKALILSRNISFKTGEGECLLELGKILFEKNDISGSYRLLQDAVLQLENNHDLSRVTESQKLLAEVCFLSGNYEQALEAQMKVVQTSKQLKHLPELGQALNQAGNIFKALKDYHQAIVHHNEALSIYEQINDPYQVCLTLFYIGNCFNWSGKLDDALSYLDRSLEKAEKLNDAGLMAKSTGSLAILFKKLNEFDRATDFFYQSVNHVNKTGDWSLKADLLRNLGNLYIEQGKFEEALKILEESLGIVNHHRTAFPRHLIHYSLAMALEGSGEYQKALNHFKLYNELSSQLLNEEVALKSKGIQLRYDVEEARSEKELAERAALLKDKFIAGLSYEIRTPLNDVLGMADVLADTHPTPEQLEYINTIRLSARNLIFLINNVLDYSRIQSGEVVLEKTEFDLQALLEEVMTDQQHLANEKRINIKLEKDQGLPRNIIGDSFRLRQILIHVLNNAVKFTKRGSVGCEVRLIQNEEQGIRIMFTITDTGIGIDPEQVNHLFDRFTHHTSSRTDFPAGTGLGLAMVKQLVELMEGNISVNSEVGKGSVFKIEIPFGVNQPLRQPTGPVRKKTGKSKKDDIREINILLVEDNKVNQFLAQKLLDKLGFKVVIASNGREALKILEEHSFDTILMDVQMPELNGYELTEIIRTTMPSPVNKIPIIALTAYASKQEKEKALSLGMSDYITKPYSPHELKTAIMKQIQSHENGMLPTPDQSLAINAELLRQNSEKWLQLFNGNREDVIGLLKMLSQQLPLMLREAESQVELKNWKSAFDVFHKIKSTVHLLRIPQLAYEIEELEEFCRDEFNTGKIPVAFKRFQQQCEKAVQLLDEEIERVKKIQPLT